MSESCSSDSASDSELELSPEDDSEELLSVLLACIMVLMTNTLSELRPTLGELGEPALRIASGRVWNELRIASGMVWNELRIASGIG
jgi:hypothetical protein